MHSPTDVNTNKYKSHANQALTQYVQVAEHLRTQILYQKLFADGPVPKFAVTLPFCVPVGTLR